MEHQTDFPMKRKYLVEAENEIEENVKEGDIIILHNTLEYILCMISYIYNTNRFVGIIVSHLQNTKKYNLADTLEFSKRNILAVVLKNE